MQDRIVRRWIGAILMIGFAGLSAASAGTLTTLHRFQGHADGNSPLGGATVTYAGTVYGETSVGGRGCNSLYGCGTVYRIRPGHGLETIVLLGAAARGAGGEGPATIAGNRVYGSAFGGGAGHSGVLFSALPDGRDFRVLHAFDRLDGGFPQSALKIDAAGNIFGATIYGGPDSETSRTGDNGVLFELAVDGTYSVLHSFDGANDGRSPTGIVLGQDGTIYGATMTSRHGDCRKAGGYGTAGCGLVFAYTPSSGVYRVLHQFRNYAEGSVPILGGVSPFGVVYGVTKSGGARGFGTLFVLRRTRTGTRYHLLHTFQGGADGGYPNAPLLDGQTGLTGTTQMYGSQRGGAFGTIYRFQAGLLDVLYTFSGKADGAYPTGVIAQDGNGVFYGTTSAGNVVDPVDNDRYGTVWSYAP